MSLSQGRRSIERFQSPLMLLVVRRDWRTTVAFCAPFFLYLLTLAPTIYNLDSAELTVASATGGITRATGYPLYVMLGYLWSWLPVGDVGYRMNLWSAFNGALTIALAERVLRRWHVGSWASFGALGLLACSCFFWPLSLIAEVYTFQTMLMAALLLLLLRWRERPTPQRLAAVGLVMGLAVSHHGATILLLPGVAWFLVVSAPRALFAPRAAACACITFLLGASCYLYLPFRYAAHPVFNYAGHYDAFGQFIPVDLQTVQGFWWLVSGQAFRAEMLAYREQELLPQVQQFGVQLWRSFVGVGIGPGLLGVVVLMRRDWRFGSALLLMFLCHVGFYTNYRVADKETMFLPAYLVWALWLGVGYGAVLSWVRTTASDTRLSSNGVMISVLVSAVLFAACWNWSLVDQSRDWSTRTRGETILGSVEPDALILGWWDTVPPIQYLQLVEDQRQDILAINRFLISPEDARLLVLRTWTRRPIYIDSVPREWADMVDARPVGELYRLLPRRLHAQGRVQ